MGGWPDAACSCSQKSAASALIQSTSFLTISRHKSPPELLVLRYCLASKQKEAGSKATSDFILRKIRIWIPCPGCASVTNTVQGDTLSLGQPPDNGNVTDSVVANVARLHLKPFLFPNTRQESHVCLEPSHAVVLGGAAECFIQEARAVGNGEGAFAIFCEISGSCEVRKCCLGQTRERVRNGQRLAQSEKKNRRGE